MFKNVFQLKKNQGRITEFHKKYFVYDGVGIVYFSTKIEACRFIKHRSDNLLRAFTFIKSIYIDLTTHYIYKVFRISANEDVRFFNSALSDIMHFFSFMVKGRYFAHYQRYMIKILDIFKSICTRFNYIFLLKRVLNSCELINYNYPLYYSSDFEKRKIQLNKNNDVKVCII